MMMGGALILLLLVAQTGDEEDTAARKAEAGKHLQRGNAAMKDGDPNEALQAYRAAYEAFPSPKIFFNMAEAHRELGELVEAAELYQRVIDELPSDSELVATAQEKLSALDAHLGRISVNTEPEGAKIEIAGREVGVSPISNIRVLAGSVEVRATIGSRTETTIVEVESGGTKSVELDLVEEIADIPPLPPPGEGEGVGEGSGEGGDEPVTSKWWFWTLIGVGVAAAAGTTAALLVTSGDDFRPSGELGTFPLAGFTRL